MGWLGYTTTYEDPSLPHQLVIRSIGYEGMVSCNCLKTRYGWTPIEVRSVWTVPEILAAWRAFHVKQGDDQGQCTTRTGGTLTPASGTGSTPMALVP